MFVSRLSGEEMLKIINGIVIDKIREVVYEVCGLYDVCFDLRKNVKYGISECIKVFM